MRRGGGGTNNIYWWGCALAQQKKRVLGAGIAQKEGPRCRHSPKRRSWVRAQPEGGGVY